MRVAVAVAITAALLLAVLQAVIRHEQAPRGDDEIYELMATHPFATHTFVFAYRIGVPTVVHVLPFSHTASFTLLAIVCAGAAAGFLFALMRELSTPPGVAAALALLFAVSPGVLIVLLRDGRNTDAATLLVMCAAALFVVRRQPVALGVTLALGAFVRESAMFMIPFAYAVWAQRPVDAGEARRVLTLAAPAIAIYAALRLSLPTVGSDQVIGYGDRGLIGERIHVLAAGLGGGVTQLRRVFIQFGPLWLVAPLALREMRYARRGLVLVALCGLSMTFALDWGRVLLLATPVIYPAAGWVLIRRPRLRAPVLLAWVAVVAGYAIYMQATGVVHGIDGTHPPPYPVR